MEFEQLLKQLFFLCLRVQEITMLAVISALTLQFCNNATDPFDEFALVLQRLSFAGKELEQSAFELGRQIHIYSLGVKIVFDFFVEDVLFQLVASHSKHVSVLVLQHVA